VIWTVVPKININNKNNNNNNNNTGIAIAQWPFGGEALFDSPRAGTSPCRGPVDERHINFQIPVAEFALNNINDFKLRCFQIQTLTFIVNSEVFGYEWRPLWTEMKLTFFACSEGRMWFRLFRERDNCSLLAPHTKYGIHASCILCWLMLVSATVIYTHAEAFLRQNSLTFFDQLLIHIHYPSGFDYYKKYCLTTSKPNTSPMFPLRCAAAQHCTTKSFAQWNLILVHVQHSKTLEKQENKEKLFEINA